MEGTTPKVGLLVIATGKYDKFVVPLLRSADKHFFKAEKVNIYLFTDKDISIIPVDLFKRFTVTVIKTEHKPFPYPTLYRYKRFISYSYSTEYLYYIDADMLFTGDVGEEILGDLVMTIHPGFFRGGGAWCSDSKSTAYTPISMRKKYYAGGFNGGRTYHFLAMAKELACNIEEDEKRCVMAEWHDESHMNLYANKRQVKELSPSYCFPQAKWAKNLPFQKKIIALEKNHSAIRTA